MTEDLSDEIKDRSGAATLVSGLTYELRGGAPDFVDSMVAVTYGNMATHTILDGHSGLMTAIVNGCYAMVPIPDPKLGPRQVDVETMYDTGRYRPQYRFRTGLPNFLSRP